MPRATEQGYSIMSEPHGVKGQLRGSAALHVLASDPPAGPLTPNSVGCRGQVVLELA